MVTTLTDAPADKGGKTSITFLPVNQASPLTREYRRAYLSCDNCRRRKSRCERSSDNTRRCSRCVREDRDCAFTQRRTKRKAAKAHIQQSSEARSTNTIPSQRHTPVDDVPVGDESHEFDAGNTSHSSESDATHSTMTHRLISTQLNSTVDALGLLAFTASKNTESTPTSGRHAINNSSTVVHETWEDFPEEFLLIRKGIITKEELFEFIDFYFSSMWQLRPLVHAHYSKPEQYCDLVREEPMLVLTIVVLGSRYHILSGSRGEIRSERIHWRAWPWLRKYLESVLWGSRSTRTCGAIASMLLWIEWHFKAINTPSDLTGELDAPSWTHRKSAGNVNRVARGKPMILEDLKLTASAFQGNRMSLMLLSGAIALAVEGGYFDPEAETLRLKAPDVEMARLWREWSQPLCVFIYFADEYLALRLGLETLLPERHKRVVTDRLCQVFTKSIPNRDLWDRHYELIGLTRNARDALKNLRSATTSPQDIVAVSEHLERNVLRWNFQSYYFEEGAARLASMLLGLDYEYLLLCIYGPAYSALHGLRAKNLPTASVSSDLERLAANATETSIRLLTTVNRVVHAEGYLRLLPVRYWLYIITAGLHLLKASLTVEVEHPNSNDTGLSTSLMLLLETVETIKQGTPDDTHSANRLAQLMEILIRATHHHSQPEIAAQAYTITQDSFLDFTLDGNAALDFLNLFSPSADPDFNRADFISLRDDFQT